MFDARVRSVHYDDFSFGPQMLTITQLRDVKGAAGPDVSVLDEMRLFALHVSGAAAKQDFMSSSCRAACAGPYCTGSSEVDEVDTRPREASSSMGTPRLARQPPPPRPARPGDGTNAASAPTSRGRSPIGASRRFSAPVRDHGAASSSARGFSAAGIA
jgi:hypothetical protein